MTFERALRLCYACNLDPANIAAMRQCVLPWIHKELAELEACRAECEQNEGWIEDWKAEGMVDRENELRDAIDTAEKRFAAAEAPENGGQADLFGGTAA